MRDPESATESSHRALARDIFRELIEIDTTDATGSTGPAAEAVAARLRAAGLPEEDVAVLGPNPSKVNLVARLRGRGAREPLLLLAHLDVVDARRDEWSVEPFALTERDGFFYGRGTTDDKAMASIWTANLARMTEQGYVPDRDIILALTADEEGGPHNGVDWLLTNHRPLVQAAYGLNEGGYGRMRAGTRISNAVQASEKVYLDFELEATGHPGHSSVPTPDNAIYHLAGALGRLSSLRLPARLGEVTRAFFQRMAEQETAEVADAMRAVLRDPCDAAATERLSAVPQYDALLRTTCAATRLEAGLENNTIPRTARAIVNCRLLPDESPEEILRTLQEAVGSEQVAVRVLGAPKPSPPSPLIAEVMEPVERITAEMWPGVPVIPVMGIGATDSLRLRRAGIPMYGVSGLFLDVDDVRAHAPDERIGVAEYFDGLRFLDRLVRALTQSVASSAAGSEV